MTEENASVEFLRLGYPSQLCRPIPSFILAMPSHWVVSEFPDALYAVGSPVGEEGGLVDEHWSNLIVHHERILPTTTAEERSRIHWNVYKQEVPQAVLKGETTVEFGELTYVVREMEIPDDTEDGDTTRIDAFMIAPDRSHATHDLFQISALHPSAAGDDRRHLILEMLASLRFE